MRLRKNLTNALIYALLFTLAVIWLIPLFFLLIHSFREEPGAAIRYLFPKTYTADNYLSLIHISEPTRP